MYFKSELYYPELVIYEYLFIDIIPIQGYYHVPTLNKHNLSLCPQIVEVVFRCNSLEKVSVCTLYYA